jgi:hypothetical protein
MVDALEKIIPALQEQFGVEYMLATPQKQVKKAAWHKINDDAEIAPAANVFFHNGRPK